MRRAARLQLFLLVSLSLASSAAAVAGAAPDRERVGWTALEFSASKLLISAKATVQARIVPAAEIAGELTGTPVGQPTRPGPEVLEMVYVADGFGRRSRTTLWANPDSGNTLQQVQLDSSGRLRERVYRFTDVGAWHYTRRPANRREETLPAADWTDRSEGLREYGTATDGQPVAAATVLVWLVSAADLAESGDRMEVLVFSRHHVNRVTIEVTGRRKARVDFVEEGPATRRRERRGEMDAIVLRLSGKPADGSAGDDEPFELLGLRGTLEMLLDPATRAPLQLRGQVRIVGEVTVRLRKAVLR